ncbi:MAG TPA: response regulator [Caldimonas sp.]|nr:response regulator [Caldimonas sp.]HEX2541113.1 response regulator [Caldimonas sp.]
MRVLVADDFLTMRRVLRGLLAQMGLTDVVDVADGAAALAQLRGGGFDAVITDIEMPIMNGFELLSAIKKDARLRHLPVLMLAAEARKDEIVRSTQDGAADYVVKPFTRATLEERLQRAAPALFAAAAGAARPAPARAA